jgi:hypothetical protein
MVALKPILHSWLEKAEEASKVSGWGWIIEGVRGWLCEYSC